MNFVCQKDQISELQLLASSDRHSILIEGSSGSGKTYLAKEYARMLKIDDFKIVQPKVADIKDTIDNCLQTDNKIVLCIENLDTGVLAASYTLLKFLEEPLPYVYIAVTCRNLMNVPDTIPSRSTVITTSPPIGNDIDEYAESINSEKFNSVRNTILWQCVKTFNDANTVLHMDTAQLNYFESLYDIMQFRDSISNIVWKIGHYDNNDPTPIELVIRYIMEIKATKHIETAGIRCIRDLEQNRIAAHAVLSKFAFECKYCE